MLRRVKKGGGGEQGGSGAEVSRCLKQDNGRDILDHGHGEEKEKVEGGETEERRRVEEGGGGEVG